MLQKNKIVLTCLAGLVLGVSSCKKFLNVNTNPNISQTATVKTLLPAAQLYIGSSVGVDLQINGSIWSQYWTQTPIGSQYQTVDQFSAGQDAFSTPWRTLYAGAENFYQLYNLADTLKNKQYKAIALLMNAYTFQLITDAWGDVPFTQALKGQYSDGHVVNPKYDSQAVVYRGIIAYIDSAYKLLNNSDAVKPGADDLIYGGNMDEWKHFANTLKLKILLRMIKIDPVGATKQIDSLYAMVPAPVFLGVGEDAVIKYGFNSSNNSPLYAEEAGLAFTQNLAGSRTCIDSMNNNNDPRTYLFYEANAAAGIPVGIAQSQYNISLLPSQFSFPSVYVAGDAGNSASANAPVNLLTSWESYFLQAEVRARGIITSGPTDSTLFYEGIQASFTYYASALDATYGTPLTTSIYGDYLAGSLGFSATAGYWTMYPTTGTTTDKLRFIITQKWFAMCGNQGFEAWTEWRRTGYPDFLVNPVNSFIGAAKPRRFLYPTSESSANTSFPGLLPITAKVWWDK